MKSNIKINYMIIEQVLRVTGAYKSFCEKYEFLDVLFKRAKTGVISNCFADSETEKATYKIMEDILGIPEKYLSGEERIKLGIRCKQKFTEDDSLGNGEESLVYDGESIDTIDLDNDEPYYHKINGQSSSDGHAYHGVLYQEILKNPLHVDPEVVYLRVMKTDEEDENKKEKSIHAIENLYSLHGLLTVLLLNISNEMALIDTTNIYKHTEWKPYVKEATMPTKQGITYCPRFVEIRQGMVQTLIKTILSSGVRITFRDLDKEFAI